MPRQWMPRAMVLAAVVAAGGFAQWVGEAVVISPGFAVEGQTIKGAPYSAKAVTSVKQTLGSIGPWSLGPLEPGSREPPTVILIQDPVRRVNITLDPRTHIARMNR